MSNVPDFTLKSLSATRWESRIESVKTVKCQIQEIREALLQVRDTDNDSKIRSEAKSLAQNELGDFEFLVSLVIWFETLCAVNEVSKDLQAEDMVIDDAIAKVKGLISFFKRYRETGFLDAIREAKKIVNEIGVEPIFPERRVIKRKRQFDEVCSDATLSREESFRTSYFIYVVDEAIRSLTSRFEQYKEFESVFGFLFSTDKLYSLDDTCLKSSCMHIEDTLKSHEKSDIDADDLYAELKLLQGFLPDKLKQPIDILKFLKSVDCFPNAIIVYKILLTIPVTVASAERSFSKLKLLKSYLRSTMTQERLNGLAMVTIENELLGKINHEELIESFVSANSKRMSLFK